VQVSVDTAGLITGTYHATITVETEAGVLGSPAQVAATLVLADHLYFTWLPVILRGYR